MHKLNIVAIVLAALLFVANIFQFWWWHKQNAEQADEYLQQVAALNATIAQYGDDVTIYTVAKPVKAGDEVTAEVLKPTKTYTSLLTDQYVTDTSTITGRFFKVAVEPGAALYKNMFMDDELEDDMRDRDITLDRMTVGIQVGDYIDIRTTLPYGDDYVILAHKRVYDINENTIKLHLNEIEWNTIQGAYIDYYLNKDYGMTIYADRYLEPGLQQSAVKFYAVPSNIAALMQKNPNILDKEGAASLNQWRKSLEEILVLFRTDDDTIESDAGKLSSGRSEFSSKVETDRKAQAEEDAQKAEEEAAAEEENTQTVSDDFWADDTASDDASDDTTASDTASDTDGGDQ